MGSEAGRQGRRRRGSAPASSLQTRVPTRRGGPHPPTPLLSLVLILPRPPCFPHRLGYLRDAGGGASVRHREESAPCCFPPPSPPSSAPAYPRTRIPRGGEPALSHSFLPCSALRLGYLRYGGRGAPVRDREESARAAQRILLLPLDANLRPGTIRIQTRMPRKLRCRRSRRKKMGPLQILAQKFAQASDRSRTEASKLTRKAGPPTQQKNVPERCEKTTTSQKDHSPILEPSDPNLGRHALELPRTQTLFSDPFSFLSSHPPPNKAVF